MTSFASGWRWLAIASMLAPKLAPAPAGVDAAAPANDVVHVSAQEPLRTTVRTAHYEIVVDGPEESEARELGRVLELAWTQYKGFLDCEPELSDPITGAKEFLRIRVAANKQAWLASLEHDGDGAKLSGELDNLLFSPERGGVYLYRQSTRWMTRSLALHGAWQQFHYRAKKKNADLVWSWFVMGLGEHFAQHMWDGEKLVLGARPRVAMRDLAADARWPLDPSKLGSTRMSDETLSAPAVGFAMTRFLLQGASGKYVARFKKLAFGQTGSKLTGAEFAAALGKPRDFAAELYGWLQQAQLPMSAAFGDWEDIDGKLMRGRAVLEGAAIARVKEPTHDISAAVSVEGRKSAAGLLLAWVDAKNYTIATAVDFNLVVEQSVLGKRLVIGEHRLPQVADRMWRMSAVRQDEEVLLLIEGNALASYRVPGESMGLAVSAGAGEFSEIEWH